MKILITGSSSGIGLACTNKLLSEGHSVIGLSRRSMTVQHANLDAFSIDLGQIKSLPEKLNTICKKIEPIDVAILSAGQGLFGHLEQFSYDQIRSVIDLNLTSAIYLTRAIIPQMKYQQQGHIIFIGSEAALRGTQQGTVYAASKFALRGFSQALREEVSGCGIRVTLINPGMVRTPFFSNLKFQPGPHGQHAIEVEDIASTIYQAITTRNGTVIDEINISPQQNVIDFKKKQDGKV
ncbi:MAG: SDR family oxidoreductase [Candidatus Latescibacterota bacterium]|nr:SDR family oxidoreductase [Candidatus Latescibacterota bacterium]